MEIIMIYPIVIHKNKSSDYGATVPDLPGCFSAGTSLDDALAMAREAIELHLEGLIEEGQLIPQPQPIERHRANPAYRTGTWALVRIEPSHLRINAKRVNVTIPERVLDALDRAAAADHDTRSGLLAKAATEYLRQRSATPKSAAQWPRPARKSAQ
jgi:predicted RNase H-like HicB family nuclease